MRYDVIVLGGGPAGVFAANAAKQFFPQAKVALLEKSAVLLAKVKISGGGRCNVAHHCFDLRELVKNYPRGSQELLGPFHHFGPKDTIEWFSKRGVQLKTEGDGRMFPITDQSQTIIDCLVQEMHRLGVDIFYRHSVLNIKKTTDGYLVESKNGQVFETKALVLAMGSSQEGHLLAESLEHTINKPVPSLFTFNIPSSPLSELSGVSLERVKLSLKDTSYSQEGPLLITHFGFSGPAALKLSAFAARYFYDKNYQVMLVVQWIASQSMEEIYMKLLQIKANNLQKIPSSESLFDLPRSLWKALLGSFGKVFQRKWGDISGKDLKLLAQKLFSDTYQIEGKTTHKEEFVTCGGVNLKEVDFKTMQSRSSQGLFFAGELLDIDGVTGGFNFQNTWTTGYLAGKYCLAD